MIGKSILWYVIGILFLLFPAPVFASSSAALQPPTALQANECNITAGSSSACPVNADGSSITNTAIYKGVRSDPGTASGAIDIGGKCRYVNNTSSGVNQKSIFVPFATPYEWQQFIDNAPHAVSLNLMHCARPGTFNIYASSACPAPSNSSSPATVSASYHDCQANGSGGCQAPYVWTPVVYFTCHPPAPGASWTETATTPFTAMDSDMHTPSWQPGTTTYRATASSCGSANGTRPSSAPTSNVCNAGAFSGVSGTGPWSWTCSTGQPPTPTAHCATAAEGQCGSDDGQGLSSTPTNLCRAGTASGISGNGPWSWTCSGTGGGTTASCSASYTPRVEAVCGGDNGQSLPSAPTNLCRAGTASGVFGGGPWSWSCYGSNGGNNANCGATVSYTYAAAFDSCPTACGKAASTLSPSGCTRSDGANVALSYCSGQSRPCSATAACTYGYTASFGSCPTACGMAATTLSPSGCTRSDGTGVDVSYCAGQTQSCAATTACPRNTCASTGVSWLSHSMYIDRTCSGTLPETPYGGSASAGDSGGYGSASYVCTSSGSWAGPTSARCDCVSFVNLSACSGGGIDTFRAIGGGVCHHGCHK